MFLPTEKLRMADCLEDTSNQDSDRNIDSCNFLREQFDIFKHDYREAFDEHGHEKLANLTLSAELKKEVVTTMRKLRRAKIGIESHNFEGTDKENIKDLLYKISAVEQELERVSRGNIEFSMNNVDLPEYDEDAIKALFGDHNSAIKDEPAVRNTIEKLCDFNRIFEDKVSGVIGAAMLLLNEYKEFEDYVKSINK